MAITTTLTPPSRTQTAEAFSGTMDAFLGALPTWAGEVNSTATEVAGYHTDVMTTAPTAIAAAEVAAANANFLGNWSSLTGALVVPAAVRHDDKNWQLLEDLADVTAAEPGVSVAWAEIKFGGGGESGVIEISENYVVSDGTPMKAVFVPQAAGLTVTMPEAPVMDGTPYVIVNGGTVPFDLMSPAGFVIQTLGSLQGVVLLSTGEATWASYLMDGMFTFEPGCQLIPGESSVFETAAAYYVDTAVLDSTHIIVAYQDRGTSYYGTACVLEVVDGAIIPGTPVVFENDGGAEFISICALDASRAVVAYANTSSHYGQVRVLSVSGTTITVGARVTFNATVTAFVSVDALSSSLVIATYVYGSHGYAVVFSISGTTVSTGGAIMYDSNAVGYGTSVAALSSTKAVVACIGTGTNKQLHAAILNISGTTVTAPGGYLIADYGYNERPCVAAVSDSLAIIVYRDATTTHGNYVLLSASSTSPSIAAQGEFSTANADYPSVTKVSDGKVAISCVEGYMSGSVRLASVIADAVRVNKPTQFDTSNLLYTSLSAISETEIILAYCDSSPSYGTACLLEVV